MKTKEEAESGAEVLLKKMTTPGWKIRVWENLGWHFEITKHSMAIHFSEHPGQYHTYLNSGSTPGGGSHYWHQPYYSDDPNEVYERQLEVAQQFIDECQEVVDRFKDE